VARQIRYEQIAFWRNPFGALFTVLFSVIFLLFLGASSGNTRDSTIGGMRLIQYYVPGFVAYGLMAACFNMLAISLVFRREAGLLKRLRLTPLPTWAMLGGIFGSAFIVSCVSAAVVIVIGRVGYNVSLPHNLLALLLALLVGVVCFSALGVAVANLIPNDDAAGPIVSIVYFVLLFVSGLWFPLEEGSALANIASWFPIRHFLLAVFAPFDQRQGVSAYAWHDLMWVGVWGLVAVVIALRRFRWEPRKA
jgi:ABC-2 type transport system permease protein